MEAIKLGQKGGLVGGGSKLGTKQLTGLRAKGGFEMKVFALLVVLMLVCAGSAFAGQVNGTANVSSAVGGAVISGNFGNGGSLAFQQSNNITTAGFGTIKNGNQVTAYTYGSSVGSTSGFAIHGFVTGFQAGSYSATATLSIPKH